MTNIGWVAGIIESEGTIGMARMLPYQSLHPYLRVSNTDMRVHEALQDFGFRCHAQPMGGKLGKKQVYVSRLSGSNGIVQILARIRTFLTSKRGRADFILNYRERYMTGRSHVHRFQAWSDWKDLISKPDDQPPEFPDDETMWAWVAGVLDGDGSITKCIRNGEHHSLDLRLVSTCRSCTTFLKDSIGGNVIIRQPRLGSKVLYLWQSYRQKANVDALTKMLPYLVVKAEKAKDGIGRIKRLQLDRKEDPPWLRPDVRQRMSLGWFKRREAFR